MSKYPEHQKIEEVNDHYTAIDTFLEEAGYALGAWEGERFYPTPKSHHEILNTYFGIDAKKIEAERQQMIEEMKEMGP